MKELEQLIESSFGGGSLLEIKNKFIHVFVVDLSRTSGINSSESYVFIKDKKTYKLVHSLPYKDFAVRKFSLLENELTSYLKTDKEEKLETTIKLKKPQQKDQLNSETSPRSALQSPLF